MKSVPDCLIFGSGTIWPSCIYLATCSPCMNHLLLLQSEFLNCIIFLLVLQLVFDLSLFVIFTMLTMPIYDMQGAKLCMLADMLGSTGSLTGVDVAKHRLSACRTMLQKYSLGDRTRLFVADGTLFSILPVNSNLRRMEGLVLKNSCSFYVLLCWNTRKDISLLVDTSS